MPSVLFVCLGNICRSPAAEGIARKLAADQGLQVTADSAGTGAWHAGHSPDARMIKAAAMRGYRLKSLRARQVTPEDFTRFDQVLAMDVSNLDALHRLYPAWDRKATKPRLLLDVYPNVRGIREVPDPYYGGPEGFELVIDLIEAAVRDLLSGLKP
jgi:protein-tyrosine phosphatase